MTYPQKIVAAWFALLLPAAPVMAEWMPSPTEMAALPAYCAAKFSEGKNPESAKSWRASMGSDFMHIHHYCAGLNFLNRARGMASGNDKRGTLGAAMSNFNYMLNNSSAGFYLRPEILMNRGITFSMLDKGGQAIGDLLKSIQMDPGQPRAYITLAGLYQKQNNRTKALETVSEGLRHNPDTKSLRRRYTELGGKLPYPAPVQAADAEASTANSTPTPVATHPAESGIAAPGVTPATAPAVEPTAAPKIGSPKNPYCRFCPD